MITPILVLYYSKHGTTKQLARHIAMGIESVPTCEAIIRTVPDVSPINEQSSPSFPTEGTAYVTMDELETCAGLALGSPVRFGNMAAPLKYFLEQTTLLWASGKLVNKPACVFTSSASMHGGQESTLLSMMLPLYHHGMVICGLPFTESALNTTTQGGTPYGPSHVAGNKGQMPWSNDEQKLAFAQGQRLAQLAILLRQSKNNP